MLAVSVTAGVLDARLLVLLSLEQHCFAAVACTAGVLLLEWKLT